MKSSVKKQQKAQKKAAKSLKKASASRTAILKKAIAKSRTPEEQRSYAYLLAIEGLKKGRSRDAELAGLGMNSSQLQPRALVNASEPAIRRAQQPLPAARSDRAALQSVSGFVGENPVLARNQTELESQRKIIDLEQDLAKATVPSIREAISWQLTKAKLVAGHRRGEI